MDAPLQLLSLVDVTAGYNRSRPTLAALDFAVSKGEIVGVTGVSGAGKTTLLKVCAGLLIPLSGRMNPTGGLRLRQAYSPQGDVLLDYRNVWENAALLLERRGAIGEVEAHTRLEQALDEVGLLARRRDPPAKLSGGMRQRLQVVQAVCAARDLLLLDEPFSEQDRDNQHRLESLVFAAARHSDLGVVIVSHDIDALSAVSDRVVFIGGFPGRLVAQVQVPPPLRAKGADARRADPLFAPLSEELWAERARTALR